MDCLWGVHLRKWKEPKKRPPRIEWIILLTLVLVMLAILFCGCASGSLKIRWVENDDYDPLYNVGLREDGMVVWRPASYDVPLELIAECLKIK